MLKTGRALSCALMLKVGKAQSHLSAKNRQSIESFSDAQKWGSLETGSRGNSLLIPACTTSILMGHFCTRHTPNWSTFIELH